MRILSKNLKKVIWLLSISMVILISGAASLYEKIKNESQSLEDDLTHIAILEKKERDFSGTTASLKDFNEEASLLDAAFLSEGEFIKLISLLESFAQKTGVKFNAESARLPNSPNEQATLSFSLEGDFISIAHFFLLLDHAPYTGILRDAIISPREKNPKILKTTATYGIFNFRKI